MKKKLLANIALFSSLLPGCLAQSSEPPPNPQPALLVAPNSVAIANAVANLLQSTQVHLADDVFLTSSKITLDRLHHKDSRGNPIMGKQLNLPDQFELLIEGKQCFVRHINSNTTQKVRGVKCKLNR